MGILRLAEIEFAGRPRRVQRSRVKGWRMPHNTISVTRPGRWGNPYFPGCGIGFGSFDAGMNARAWPVETPEWQVKNFREHMRLMILHEPERFEEYIAPLRGKNLACFCPLDRPCHADVLLELANP
jgi:hypothetical protein